MTMHRHWIEDGLSALSERGEPWGPETVIERSRQDRGHTTDLIGAAPAPERGRPRLLMLVGVAATAALLIGALSWFRRSTETVTTGDVPGSVAVPTSAAPSGPCRLAGDCTVPTEPTEIRLTEIPEGFQDLGLQPQRTAGYLRHIYERWQPVTGQSVISVVHRSPSFPYDNRYDWAKGGGTLLPNGRRLFSTTYPANPPFAPNGAVWVDITDRQSVQLGGSAGVTEEMLLALVRSVEIS
jgi:hypothetical protein